jgi:hypothetical protein
MRGSYPLRLDWEQLTIVPTEMEELVLRHAHLDDDILGADASLLNMYMLSAINWFESETKRSVVARSHRWVLRGFPCDEWQEIRLPRGKTQSVQSIQYVTSGQSFTLTGESASPAGADFQEDIYGTDGGILMPNRANAWPAVDFDTPAPVVLSFIAGWTVSEIPPDAMQALLFAVSDAYEIRGTSDAPGQFLGVAGEFLGFRQGMVAKYALRRVY